MPRSAAERLPCDGWLRTCGSAPRLSLTLLEPAGPAPPPDSATETRRPVTKEGVGSAVFEWKGRQCRGKERRREGAAEERKEAGRKSKSSSRRAKDVGGLLNENGQKILVRPG
eukprot:417246-Hanusia_phi.AAC.2